MEYFLQPALLSPPPALEISEHEFFELKEAKAILSAAFAIEENFDLLVGNYLELEASALSIVATTMVRRVAGYQELFELRADINRRAVNLLTSARLFVDHLPQRYKKFKRDSEEVKSLLNAEYDKYFEYRFMEALRNYVQHSGLAIHSLSVSNQWHPPQERVRAEYSLIALVVRKNLIEEEKFKQKVLDECPEKVDFLTVTRRYIESLGEIQRHVRNNATESVEAAKEKVSSTINKYREFASASCLGLEANAARDGNIYDRVSLLLDWEEVRKKLSDRNNSMMNLSRCSAVSAARNSEPNA